MSACSRPTWGSELASLLPTLTTSAGAMLDPSGAGRPVSGCRGPNQSPGGMLMVSAPSTGASEALVEAGATELGAVEAGAVEAGAVEAGGRVVVMRGRLEPPPHAMARQAKAVIRAAGGPKRGQGGRFTTLRARQPARRRAGGSPWPPPRRGEATKGERWMWGRLRQSSRGRKGWLGRVAYPAGSG